MSKESRRETVTCERWRIHGERYIAGIEVILFSMRRGIWLVLAAFGASTVVLQPALSYADKLSDAKKKAQDLQQQEKSTQAKISQLKSQEQTLQQQIQDLEDKIQSLQVSIAKTQADIDKRTAEINQLKEKIEETQKQIDEQYGVLADRVRVMYEAGQASYLDVLFSSTSFSDLLDRLELLERIAKQDKAVLEDIRAKKQQLDAEQQQLNAQLAQLQSQRQVLTQQKQQQEQAQQSQQKLLAQVHAQRVSEESQLNSENAALKSLQKLIAQLEAEQGGYTGPAGGWTWPVPGYRTISSGYGWRNWSDGSREFHNGIDIPAPLGTPIVAATSGKVLYAGPASGFGDWIVIQSSGGLLEIYGHMYAYQIKVQPGQVVHTGQTIAAVGSNGFSTGPHLHFTIATGFDSSGFPVSVDPTKYVGR
ncbi:Septal ring factor EnvC, activator of murein hydrolases AmiA and AmiB [Alicyclobacillus macrosporangiidus]|uniref:Septal ring factor EnvC, activator of murein hydrolases AmiA and AmiB n=2 Tax=Alicyclobacillus macrosporangiidus TaxID=392015 RepID=A0A1I7L9J0_9BACL|nr:Septal ring factor EnvC, activator of murein hydrolases AmiA and AmiB [Alicyclobacillus macrosporangiidus]